MDSPTLARALEVVDRPFPAGDPGADWVRITGDELLLRIGAASLAHYAPSQGLAIARDPGDHPETIELFRQGSVAAGIAALHGLQPLHASSVLAPQGAVALCGPSGAGKSTAAAALAQRGMPLLADDLTLLGDPDSDGPVVLPWRKRLKLWPEGLALARLAGSQRVSPEMSKLYVDACPLAHDEAPLVALVVLEQGDGPVFERLRGGAAVAAWEEDHYCSHLHALASRHTRGDRFALACRRAAAVPTWRFVRPFDPSRFDAAIDLLADRLRNLPS